MNFENIEVGDKVKYKGKITDVIMKDHKRMVCDISDEYITDWSCLRPVEITDCNLLYIGYERLIYDNTKFVKKIKAGNKTITCSIVKIDNKYNISIETPFTKKLKNIPVTYIVQITRLEEALRILSLTDL